MSIEVDTAGRLLPRYDMTCRNWVVVFTQPLLNTHCYLKKKKKERRKKKGEKDKKKITQKNYLSFGNNI